MRPSQGDIVLIPVPFTDLSSTKRRPVIVVSHNLYHQSSPDMLVVAMTSNPTQTPYSFTITNDDVVQGRLNRPGTIRVDKVYSLEQSLIVNIFGRVNSSVLKRIQAILLGLTSLPTAP
jgi:mRNA interferase MazF